MAVSWLATPPSTFFCELPCLSVRLSINQSLCVQENLIMPSPKKNRDRTGWQTRSLSAVVSALHMRSASSLWNTHSFAWYASCLLKILTNELFIQEIMHCNAPWGLRGPNINKNMYFLRSLFFSEGDGIICHQTLSTTSVQFPHVRIRTVF